MCGMIRDDRETSYERWIPKEVYVRETGIDPGTCRLNHTYCSNCYVFLKAA
jgi:hypothetical protein